MFSKLFSVRLKAAEQALAGGRLEDAFRAATQPDIAGHQRGAKLLAGLADAFHERARAHFRAERFADALLDLNRAEACGGQQPRIAELRGQVLAVADEVARQEAEHRQRIEQARMRVQSGSLIAGRRLIEDEGQEDAAARQLGQEIHVREREAEDLLKQAETLWTQNQPAAAAERLAAARRLHPHHPAGLELEARICAGQSDRARQSLQSGRLKRARVELDALGGLGEQNVSRQEIEEMLQVAYLAVQALRDNEFANAERFVQRLKGLCPQATWLETAAEQLARVDDALLILRGGPLGEELGGEVVRPADARTPGLPSALADTVAFTPPRGGLTPGLPSALLLLMDGGGSYLIQRGNRAVIGRAASSNPADLPVLADLSERHAELNRVEEDYFLTSTHEVEIGGQRTRQHLLRDGDRVVLGPRAKFTFRLPNRKSASAVMDASDLTRLPNDVRRIVLLRDTAMVGRGSHCHVSCPSARGDHVLFERGGRLWIGSPGQTAAAIELGRQMEVAGMSFLVKPWTLKGPGLPGSA